MSDAATTDNPTAARERAAAALRSLGHALMSHEADDELLDRVAIAAARVTTELQGEPRRERDFLRIKRELFEGPGVTGQRMSHFGECFVSGELNPMGINMSVHSEGKEAVTEVLFDWAFEGAPGRVHGGLVAAVFDDLMGYVLMIERIAAFTGELTIRYHAPTPIHTPVTFRARAVGKEGRKLSLSADAYAGETKVATATGLFIEVDVTSFQP